MIYFLFRGHFLILLLMLAESSCLAQVWSEPVVIYNNGYNRNPDFTIDKKGTLHCVWSHRITNEFRKIYYSKSTDQGNTWTSPVDISKNTEKWLDEPHIVADTNNRLHVVYDYDLMNLSQTRICYVTLEHTSWSQPVFLADDLPGSSYNRLVVDNQNKLYCFWYRGVIFYRCLENGSWSDIHLPYSPPSGEKYFLTKVVVDKNNDLHCTGSHHYAGQTPYDDRVIYFTMTSGQWNDLIEISDNRSWWGSDLSLNASGLPEFTWGQFRNDTAAYQVGTFYSRLTPYGLSDSVMLTSDATDPAILVDGNDKVHVVDNRNISKSKYGLVCFDKNNENWTESVLDTNTFPYVHHVLRQYKSKIYWVLNRLDANDVGPDPASTILLYKRDIPYFIDQDPKKPTLNLYPNPFTEKVYIEFTRYTYPVNIAIYDNKGRMVFYHQIINMESGEHGFYWTGCDTSGNLLPSGLYFVTLQSGHHSITRPVIFLGK